MNERIKELAEQSLCIKGGEFAFNGGEVELVDLEKFAQMIVQECAKVIFETPVDYMETDTMHRIRDSVKQHFGVEP